MTAHATKARLTSAEGRARLSRALRIAERMKDVQSRIYVPHDKGADGGQLAFHRSTAITRGLFPGNGWGKTVAAVHEANFFALGKSPYRDDLPDPPVNIRHLADGWETGVDDVLLPIYQATIEPADLEGGSWERGYSKKYRRITYANGSRIQFMSYNLSDRGKGAIPYAGKRLDLVIFDEHGPYEVWDENQARIGKRDLHSIVCLTPILGMTWEYEEIVEPFTRGDSDIQVFSGEMTDNPHLSADAVHRYLTKIGDPRLRDVRRSGEWINLGGDVYPQWNEDIHAVPYEQRRVDKCTATVIIDPHPSKPTAVLWCGVEEDGTMFAFREYKSKDGPADIAAAIRTLSENKHIQQFIIDPNWGWVNNLHKKAGEEDSPSPQDAFMEAGLKPMVPGSKQKTTRINLLRSHLEPSPTQVVPHTGRPYTKFQVMQTCPELMKEFPRYRYKPQTEGMKASDRVDTIDDRNDLLVCCEYYVMSNPYYMGSGRNRKDEQPLIEFDEFGYPRQVKETAGGRGNFPGDQW